MVQCEEERDGRRSRDGRREKEMEGGCERQKGARAGTRWIARRERRKGRILSRQCVNMNEQWHLHLCGMFIAPLSTVDLQMPLLQSST